MFRRALFPADFSEPANRLLECLGAFRPLGVEEVVLLHVTDVRQAVNLLGFDMTFYERHDDGVRPTIICPTPRPCCARCAAR